MQKNHFITYANQKFINAKRRICNEAINSKWFHTVKGYGPNNLEKNFKQKYNKILSQKKGGGYWIWKLNIIQQKLRDISENDILIYCDAGCHINKSGESRFREYINMLNNSTECIISFQMGHKEKKYTTKQIFDYFKIDINSNIANSGQYIGGILIMKKNDKLLNIFKEYEKILNYNQLLISDHYNRFNKRRFKYFIDNRHDQSIFSVIRKIFGSIILTDETYGNFQSNLMKKYPFWAVRKKK
jgi:hypothetical protein